MTVTTSWLVLIAVLQNSPVEAVRAPPRPNVLLVTMDQLAYSWVGALGTGFPKVDTPALNRLISEGVVYRKHYADNEVCHPSRSSMLTGKPPICHGALDNGVILAESEVTWAEILQALGWRTGAFGKIHTQAEGAWQGFEQAIDSDQIYAWLAQRGIFPDQNISWLDPQFKTGIMDLDPKYVRDSLVTEMALRFMRDSGDPSWFVYLSYGNPHPPTAPLPGSWAGVAPTDVPSHVPQASYFFDKPTFTRLQVRNRGYLAISPDRARLHYQGYVAMIEEADRQLGRVLSWIQANETDRPTIVVFTSDHGDMGGQLGLFDKLFGPYESAVHVPTVIAMPGILPAGAVVDELSQHSDLLPTVLDLLGIRRPSDMVGKSLLGLAHGGPAVHDYVFSGRERGNLSRMIFDGRWSLIWHGGRESELYDLQSDPEQVLNLFSAPQFAADRDRLLQALINWTVTICR